jgi:hypothetical protein
MSDTILTQRGQVLNLQITWWQGAAGGEPLDLTTATITIRESNRPAVFALAVLSVVNAAAGICGLSFTEEDALGLGDGRTNWFRLEAQFPDDSNSVTPKIWINVQ